MALPIIFIHKGDSSYLIDTFYQVRKSNPNAPIFLIGTPDLKKYENQSLVTFIHIDDYLKEAIEFGKIYKHFNSNGYDYELFCIQRWFVLKEFLRSRNIDRCLYLDSDVLFYSDVDKVAKNFDNFGMTISIVSGHTNFLSATTLDDFCNYITKCYMAPNAVDVLQNYHDEFKSRFGGGVSDMTFLWKFYQEYPNKVFDYFTWEDSEQMIDLNINDGEAVKQKYISDGKILKVIWKDKMPYYIHVESGKEVLTHTLHFQGGSKSIMSNYIPTKDLYYYYLKLSRSFFSMYSRLKNKFS